MPRNNRGESIPSFHRTRSGGLRPPARAGELCVSAHARNDARPSLSSRDAILLLASPVALAAGPPIPLIVDPAGPPPLTLEEKVKLSSYVIVGEVQRLVS